MSFFSSIGNSRGSTKRRILEKNYAVRPSGLTRALSPSPVPTDHGHAVPTRAYQCDQSSRYTLGCYRCCWLGKLKAHQRDVFPPNPPSPSRSARTVLALKGRCAAPNTGAPLPAVRRSSFYN
jgi:hypothetical protein